MMTQHSQKEVELVKNKQKTQQKRIVQSPQVESPDGRDFPGGPVTKILSSQPVKRP